jgi:four helix bundle protein
VPKIDSFEQFIAWQKARDLTREVYRITRQPAIARDFGFSNQIQRAAVSVMSNIAEGFERGGRPEFAQFLSIAKASCGEVRSLLYVAFDAGYIDSATFEDLRQQAIETGRLVGGLRASVARQRDAQSRP